MNEIVGTIYYVLANDPTRCTQCCTATSNNNNTVTATTNDDDDDDTNKNDPHYCANDDDDVDYWADHAEADTYYLFHNLMLVGDIRDVYYSDLDHTRNPTGLYARIQNIEDLLQKHDPVLYRYLRVVLKLETSYYTIRWLTTLLCREFTLPDTIRLWVRILLFNVTELCN